MHHVFHTFRMDTCSRDCDIVDITEITWNTLNDFIRHKVGHPLSRWFLVLDLRFYNTLRVPLETIETLRHEVRLSEKYISKDFGKPI